MSKSKKIDVTIKEAISYMIDCFPDSKWATIKEDEVEFDDFSGGYSNRLYLFKLKNPNSIKTKDDHSPNEVLIRLYGGNRLVANDSFHKMTEVGETLLFQKCGELGIGPKLHGLIKNGRIEEYIPSRTIIDEDFQNPKIREELARKMARFHAIDLPLKKKPTDQIEELNVKITKFFKVRDHWLNSKVAKNSKADSNFIANFDFKGEMTWLRSLEPRIHGRTVLSQNDGNRSNILIRDELGQFNETAFFIDYEFASTNQRGVDIGGHFMWFMHDITKPNFQSTLDYPSEEIRKEFIRHYLDQYSKSAKVELDQCSKSARVKLDPKFDSVEHVLMESEFYGMVYTLFFSAWILEPEQGFVSEHNPAADGFIQWVESLLREYEVLKRDYQKKYGHQ